jgi:hypothetical protein
MEGYIKDYRQELGSDVWSMPPLYHRIWQYIKYTVNHHIGRIPQRDGSFIELQPGQTLTSYRSIAQGVGWYERGLFKVPNVKTVQEICEWLSLNNMITINHGESNRQYTLITLVNWGFYQCNDMMKVTEDKQKINSKETEDKQSADINKKDNNINNNYIYTPIAPAENLEGGAQHMTGKGDSITPAEKPESGAQIKSGKGKKKGDSFEYSEEFERFWVAYPRRIGKRKAYANWTALLKEKVSPDEMINACINYAKYCEYNDLSEVHVKHPEGFLSFKYRYYESYINYKPLLPKEKAVIVNPKIITSPVANAGAYKTLE